MDFEKIKYRGRTSDGKLGREREFAKNMKNTVQINAKQTLLRKHKIEPQRKTQGKGLASRNSTRKILGTSYSRGREIGLTRSRGREAAPLLFIG